MAQLTQLPEVALEVGAGLITECVAARHFPARRLLSLWQRKKPLTEKAFQMRP